MKRLYEKSEIWFAVGWILIYVLVMGNLQGNFGEDSPLSLLGLGVIAGVLGLFVFKNGLGAKYGFCRADSPKKYLYFLPFALLATVNFWPGVSSHYQGGAQVYAVLSMALAGFVEEVLFRGLLFRAIEKDSAKQAIVISAVTFGAGHIVNLLTGQAALDTVLQVFYAIAIGFSFVMVFYKSKSILPCIVTHSLINMTSTFSAESTPALDCIISVIVIAVAGGYAYYLAKLPNRE